MEIRRFDPTRALGPHRVASIVGADAAACARALLAERRFADVRVLHPKRGAPRYGAGARHRQYRRCAVRRFVRARHRVLPRHPDDALLVLDDCFGGRRRLDGAGIRTLCLQTRHLGAWVWVVQSRRALDLKPWARSTTTTAFLLPGAGRRRLRRLYDNYGTGVFATFTAFRACYDAVCGRAPHTALVILPWGRGTVGSVFWYCWADAHDAAAAATEPPMLLTLEDTTAPGLTTLGAGDFPDGWDRADLVVDRAPIPPECIVHRGAFGHWRLLWRAAWRLPHGGAFLSATFVLDTGAPLPVYLSVATLRAFRDHGLVHADDDFYRITIFGRRYRCVETPASHEPGSILGLPVLLDLGLRLDGDGFALQRVADRACVEP